MQLSIKHLTFNAKKIIIIIKKQISVVELITMQKEIKKNNSCKGIWCEYANRKIHFTVNIARKKNERTGMNIKTINTIFLFREWNEINFLWFFFLHNQQYIKHTTNIQIHWFRAHKRLHRCKLISSSKPYDSFHFQPERLSIDIQTLFTSVKWCNFIYRLINLI